MAKGRKSIPTSDGVLRTVKPETFDEIAEPHGHFPTFTVNVEDIPASKKWDNNRDYPLKVVGRQMSKRFNKHTGKDEVTFEVRKIASLDK